MNDYFEVKLGRLIEAVNKNGTLEVDLDNRKLSLKKSINDDKLKDILPKLVSSDISNGTPQDISQACDSPAKNDINSKPKLEQTDEELFEIFKKALVEIRVINRLEDFVSTLIAIGKGTYGSASYVRY